MTFARSNVALIMGLSLGAFGGLGGYTFVYANGASYFSNEPGACANCHVMWEFFDGWSRSSHRSAATCNDCHTPPGFLSKYASKASNGFWHSFAFTTGSYPDPISIKQHNRRVAEQACRTCHGPLTDTMGAAWHGTDASCIRCHGAVGHPSLMAPAPYTTR